MGWGRFGVPAPGGADMPAPKNRTPCRRTDRALGWGSLGHVLQAAPIRLGEPDKHRSMMILIAKW